jgi:tetratricopeptide (TPR) repeat protein
MPEKSLQEVGRAMREQYEKGRLAFERNNLDYAISLLSQLLEREPGFYPCREALRAAQYKRGAHGGGLFRKMLGSGPKVLQAQVAARKNPAEALRIAEEILSSDPNSAAAHKVIADAALELGFPKTAQLSLDILYKQDPRDRDVGLKLARLLARSGQGKRAEAMMQALAAAHPHDSEVIQTAKDVAANRTLTEGGYEALEDGQGSYRDILRNEKEAISLEQEKRDYKTADAAANLIGEYEQQLAAEPDNQRALRAIAELYAQKDEFDKALQCYERLAAVETGDPSLEKAIAQTRIRRIEHQIAQLDPAVPEQAAQIQQMQAEKQEFALTEARKRVESYPNDLQLRFELGLQYFAGGRIPEAMQEFQKSQNNPHIRIQAMYHLGQCFARRRMFDLAARTFENAIKEKPVFDEEKKDLLYALGTALEAMGRKEDAIERFKLIYEADITFKDVAAKVDAYYASLGT